MADGERAEVLARASLALRLEARAALSPRAWQRSVEAVQASGALAAR